MVELTETQETLLNQLKSPFFRGEYNIKAILTIHDGLRLHTKRYSKVINIDITYNYGKDLYEIKAYRVNSLKAECEQIANHEDVYFYQLHEIIRGVLFNN